MGWIIVHQVDLTPWVSAIETLWLFMEIEERQEVEDLEEEDPDLVAHEVGAEGEWGVVEESRYLIVLG